MVKKIESKHDLHRREMHEDTHRFHKYDGRLHEGKSTHRLNDNPMEKAYHDAWLNENTPESFAVPDGNLLGHLLGDGNRCGDVSERDALVAATVIQWLGSPVGQNFVEKVMAESGLQIVDAKLESSFKSWPSV